MATNILDFKNALVLGGVRANQFRVTMTFPAAANAGNAGEKGQFLCNAASLPGSQIGVAPLMFRGREVKFPGERTFTNWSITVINDDFSIRNAFENWMRAIHDTETVNGELDMTAISGDMLIEQLSRNDDVLKAYRLVDAWPVNLGDIQLSFSDNDKIEEFNVELAYTYWQDVTGTT